MHTWKIAKLTELTPKEIHALYHLRCAVFIVEQDCPYQDVDDDDLTAYHVLGYSDGKLAACARVMFPQNTSDSIVFGRIAVSINHRKEGLGKKLTGQTMDFIKEHAKPGQTIKISAQAYLNKFYQGFGFEPVGETYLEDDIPHIAMIATV